LRIGKPAAVPRPFAVPARPWEVRTRAAAPGPDLALSCAFIAKRERPRRLPQELVVTADMHERERIMFDRADGFVALRAGLAGWRNWSNSSPGHD
jgi:hypothetical protein